MLIRSSSPGSVEPPAHNGVVVGDEHADRHLLIMTAGRPTRPGGISRTAGLAGAAALMFMGIAVGWWFFLLAAGLGIIGLIGWVFEFFHGEHAV